MKPAPARPTLLGLLPAALLTACGAGTAGSGAELDNVPELALEEVFRVGSVDDPEAGFSSPGAMAMDPEGNLYVFENQDMEIRVLDRTGARVATFGRRGRGPGEFASRGRLGIVGDTLWVVESGGFSSGRTSFFSRAGDHLTTRSGGGSIQVTIGDGLTGIIQPRSWRRDGSLEGALSMIMEDPSAEKLDLPPGAMVRVPRVRFDLEGNVIDTIGFQPRPAEENPFDRPRIEVEGRTITVPAPPADDPRTITLADGYVIISGPTPSSDADATLTFTRTGLTGDTLHHRAFGYTPEVYTEAYLDSLAWRTAARSSAMVQVVDGEIHQNPPLDDPAPVAKVLRSNMEFPPYAPPVRSVVGGEDGSAWIRWTDDGSLRDRWIVLGPEGEPRGRFTLPRNATISWASGSEFVVVERDELDVPWVVRYRLPLE